MSAVPRGVWYDAPNRRWRVRRYKNRKAYLVGYFDTLEQAVAAHAELDRSLNAPTAAPAQHGVPSGRFFDLARAALASINVTGVYAGTRRGPAGRDLIAETTPAAAA